MVFSEYAKISLDNLFEITARPDFLYILQKLDCYSFKNFVVELPMVMK